MEAHSNSTNIRGIIWLLLFPLLLGCQTMAPNDSGLPSPDPYKGGEYPAISARWTREARIYRGFDVELIAAATFKTAAFRKAYADEYARVFLLAEAEKDKLVSDQNTAAKRYHDFLLAAFVPEKKWNDFDKKGSVWKVYLTTDGQRHLDALEIRRVRKVDAAIGHFYPFVTPWKVVYRLRFPQAYPGTSEPVIGDNNEVVSLVITGVRGTTTMQWHLDDPAF
jgi:hypothetical protein